MCSRPYRVIGGLVLSFSLVTLVGSALLSLLHLPQDAIRWVALVALVAIGLGLIFPRVRAAAGAAVLPHPTKAVRVPQQRFGLGLALGVLYVPCAGPVLAAIVVAGATATIGLPTVVLTVAFALGAAVPLLIFALAGQRVAERVSAFRRRQREIRVDGGHCDHPARGGAGVQPAGGAAAGHSRLHQLSSEQAGRRRADPGKQLGGIVNDQNAAVVELHQRRQRNSKNCGPAPDIKGITAWLNTPGNKPIDLHALRGKVVLIDFWAYSCINCQRAIPHVEGWYKAYHDDGFDVIGVHTPEYAFEKVTGNVAKGARRRSASPTRSLWTTATRRGRTTATSTGPPNT